MDTPIKRTRYDKLMISLTLLALVSTFIPILFYNQLGEGYIIPIHYNVAGEIDGWGSRSFLWIIPSLSLLLFLGLFIYEKNYKKYNYPFKITPNNAVPVYRLGVQLIRHLNLFCIITFSYLNNSSLAIALGYGSGINKYVMIGLVASIIGVIVIYYLKMLEYKE